MVSKSSVSRPQKLSENKQTFITVRKSSSKNSSFCSLFHSGMADEPEWKLSDVEGVSAVFTVFSLFYFASESPLQSQQDSFAKTSHFTSQYTGVAGPTLPPSVCLRHFVTLAF